MTDQIPQGNNDDGLVADLRQLGFFKAADRILALTRTLADERKRIGELCEELEQQADGCSAIIALLGGQTSAVAASLKTMLSMQEAAARASLSKPLSDGE